MHKPHWYLLTKELIKRKEITTGITIPFLYGAYLKLGYDIKNIEDLFSEVIMTPAPYLPVIQMCDVIKFHVLKYESKQQVRGERHDEKRLTLPDTNNFITISYNTQIGNTLRESANSLRSLYQMHIDARNYSWSESQKRWRPFNQLELNVIEHIA